MLLFEQLQGGYCDWSGGLMRGSMTGERTKSRSEECYGGKYSRVKSRESWDVEERGVAVHVRRSESWNVVGVQILADK